MQYVRLADGLTRYKLIPENENIWDHIKSNNSDYYLSLYKYNQTQYNQWKEKGTVSGIKDVTTNKLFFDFDNASDPELARQDAITLTSRLLSKGIPQDTIQIAYSGQKGYSVEVDTTETFTPEEFKNITKGLAGDLACFDPVVADPQRIIRVVGTKHPKSGLYKFPLSVNQLSELPIDVIKTLASDVANIDETVMQGWTEIVLPSSISDLKVSKKKEEKTSVDIHDLDLSKKPKWLTDAKYALQEGYFGAGERNTAFMIMGSTYKGQGFSKEITYRALKGVAEVQAERNGVDRYSDKELWNNIVEVIYKSDWKGGTYSYENTPLLQAVTKRLGLKVPTEGEKPFIPVENVTDIFKKFALDIDKNTIKLGIDSVDKEVRITTSMLVGLLAAPSAGKTSVSLGVLNSISKSNLKSLFFSLDMGAPLVFQRLIQRHTGYSGKRIFEMYKNKDPKVTEFESIVAKEYKNVHFCFKSGIGTEQIKEYILQQEQLDGERAKLIVVDYLECLQGPFADSTANTALIAQQLKDIANELEVCILLLLQPQKQAGDPSAELLSMRQVKGSSVVEQAASIIFTIYRPGFSPKSPEEDKYLTMAVVKNRMGQLGTFNFAWDGVRGEITELDDLEQEELKELKNRKAQEKAAKEQMI